MLGNPDAAEPQGRQHPLRLHFAVAGAAHVVDPDAREALGLPELPDRPVVHPVVAEARRRRTARRGRSGPRPAPIPPRLGATATSGRAAAGSRATRPGSRGDTASPLTALPRTLAPAVVPSSSSTAPSERRSDEYARSAWNDSSLSNGAVIPWYSGRVVRPPYAGDLHRVAQGLRAVHEEIVLVLDRQRIAPPAHLRGPEQVVEVRAD